MDTILPSRFYPLEFPLLDLCRSGDLPGRVHHGRSRLLRRRHAVLFSSPKSSPFRSVRQVVNFCQVPLTRNTPVHACPRPRSAHARSVHGSRRASQFRPTPQPSVPSVPTIPRISFSAYLRRPLRYSHRPSHNTHPENPSSDFQTDRSFYTAISFDPHSMHSLVLMLNYTLNCRLI